MFNCDKYMKLVPVFFCFMFIIAKFAKIPKYFVQSVISMIAAFRNSGQS